MEQAQRRACALAKISRPQGNRPVLRPRLFERLVGLRHAAIIWIAAPPGAGKTTLISCYLAERGLLHLWYQLDADDADVATFFHYLAWPCARPAPGSTWPCPPSRRSTCRASWASPAVTRRALPPALRRRRPSCSTTMRRLIDKNTHLSDYPFAGADIDAVGAITSVPPFAQTVPEPGSFGLALGALGLCRRKDKGPAD